MVFGLRKAKFREVGAQALDDMLRNGTALVVDVREEEEFAAGHIPGAINIPLSSFMPDRVPEAAGRVLVLNCLGGKRSAAALDRCALAGLTVDTHLSGGFNAWMAAGLPVAR